MADIRLFAPYAENAKISSLGKTHKMTPHANGIWTASVSDIAHGVDYAFFINGEGPIPDPRSPWQPEGVHGPSRWVEHRLFAWNDSRWQPPPIECAIFYELHMGTFTDSGTFEAAIEKLEYLLDLGITHVEVMPVAEFAGNRGWGYDGVSLFAPHHAYGGPEGLKRFVDACHQKGLAVVLDVVYNHLGPEGNYLGKFGPYFTHKYSTPWGDAINFDGAGSVEVRRFIIDNALMWLKDYHVDALRIDAVHAILDTSAIHILEQMASEVKTLKAASEKSLALIAESDLNDPRVIHPVSLGGYGIDLQWNEDFHHALHALLTKERSGYYQDFGAVADLAKALTQGFVYDGCYSAYRRRLHGREAKEVQGCQFAGFLQNHDQVGNRALGERASHLISEGRLKIGAALVFASPFIPLLFQGEEWGASSPFLFFTDFQDENLGEAVRKGRKSEFAAFGWDPEAIADPQSMDTFIRSKLKWEEQNDQKHRGLLQWYHSLIALRRKHPSLKDGRMDLVKVVYDEPDRWLTLQRGSLWIACNFSDKPLALSPPREFEIVLTSFQDLKQGPKTGKGRAITLPSESVAICECV